MSLVKKSHATMDSKCALIKVSHGIGGFFFSFSGVG